LNVQSDSTFWCRVLIPVFVRPKVELSANLITRINESANIVYINWLRFGYEATTPHS